MKIIGKDNFCRDTVSDILVCENVNSYYGEKLLNHLKSTLEHDTCDYVYYLVEDDYKLYDHIKELYGE